MKINLPDNMAPLFVDDFPIRCGELDAFAHVNSCSFFTYMETVRLNWMRSAGIPVLPSDSGIVVSTAFCNYHKQIKFPEHLEACMYVSDVRCKSFETWHELRRIGEPDLVFAQGGATIEWVDFAVGKAQALPQWIRARLECVKHVKQRRASE